MDFDADIDATFFDEFKVDIVIGVGEAAVTYSALIDQDLEVIDEQGMVDLVQYAATVKPDVLFKGLEFTYLGDPWKAGRVLEKTVDGKLLTWEIVGNG